MYLHQKKSSKICNNPTEKVSGGKEQLLANRWDLGFRKAVVAEAPSCTSHTDSLTLTHLHIEHFVKYCINKTLNQGYIKKTKFSTNRNQYFILADQFQFDLTCLSGPKETHNWHHSLMCMLFVLRVYSPVSLLWLTKWKC